MISLDSSGIYKFDIYKLIFLIAYGLSGYPFMWYVDILDVWSYVLLK